MKLMFHPVGVAETASKSLPLGQLQTTEKPGQKLFDTLGNKSSQEFSSTETPHNEPETLSSEDPELLEVGGKASGDNSKAGEKWRE